jgi:hypothetical protein
MLGDIGMQMEIGGSEVARRAADLSDSPRWPRGIPWCLFLDSAPTYVGDLRTALISIQKRDVILRSGNLYYRWRMPKKGGLLCQQ